MNLNKHLEFINPVTYPKEIHIIGVGAIGSRVAEMLVRLGFSNLHIYDFDTVDDYNVTNQVYTSLQIGLAKTVALTSYMLEINPHVKIVTHERYISQPLRGAIFLCVDSINLRREIVTANLANQNIDIMFDIRMRLTDAQGYCAQWSDYKEIQALLNSMQFDDSEDSTPVSVCGTSLSIAPTVLTIVSLQINNFIRFLKKEATVQVIFSDPMMFTLQTIKY